ncbi:MAG: response regulator [Clostridia bacterium]|nr:response regulator [Clostridia bacterium]
MPNKSGIEATRRIKKRFPQIKIIVTTSYTDPRTIDMAREAGADSFWFKDFSPIELTEVMDKTVSGENYWPENCPMSSLEIPSSAD